MILLPSLCNGAYGVAMRSVALTLFCLLSILQGNLLAQGQPPRDNPYDVIGKMFQPFWGVFLSESVGANKAMNLTMEVEGVVVKLDVQFPDKIRLEAPVLGDNVVICRDGEKVWATPGSKINYLMKTFRVKPGDASKYNTPIPLPITAQQAIFLPALFTVERSDVAEVDEIDGTTYRVLTAGLMPELARAVNAENFRARIWVGSNYSPRRIELRCGQFNSIMNLTEMVFSPELPSSTWEVPVGAEDIYSTNSDMLEGLLSAVMNSLGTIAPRISAR